LADSHRILLSPTIQHHIHASQIRPQKRRMGVFVGCSAGLSHTREELDSILKCEPNVEVHDPCARRDWPQTGDWKVWHYTGHARLRSDNPFYSSLTLADGPLFGADFRLKRCRVGLVTLAACRTAHHSVLAGEEATGLVRSLLEMGARNVIGSHWSVGDKSTSYWMTRFYGAVLNGTSVTESARQASLITREKYPSVYQWAPFSVFGAG
jgi:CHAT domain-containing protein